LISHLEVARGVTYAAIQTTSSSVVIEDVDNYNPYLEREDYFGESVWVI